MAVQRVVKLGKDYKRMMDGWPKGVSAQFEELQTTVHINSITLQVLVYITWHHNASFPKWSTYCTPASGHVEIVDLSPHAKGCDTTPCPNINMQTLQSNPYCLVLMVF
eukprot:5847097-Amphidinium_carterae.2